MEQSRTVNVRYVVGDTRVEQSLTLHILDELALVRWNAVRQIELDGVVEVNGMVGLCIHSREPLSQHVVQFRVLLTSKIALVEQIRHLHEVLGVSRERVVELVLQEQLPPIDSSRRDARCQVGEIAERGAGNQQRESV